MILWLSIMETFLLTRLSRGATLQPTRLIMLKIFLLTRLSRGATLLCISGIAAVAISTHTPPARRDGEGTISGKFKEISTHTPLARRDNWDIYHAERDVISTHTPLARRDRLGELIVNII